MSQQRRQAVGLWVLDKNTDAWVPLGMDKSQGALTVISAAHHRVHTGLMWDVSHHSLSLADDGTLALGFDNPVDTVAHFTVSGVCGGDAFLELIEGCTLTDKVTHPVYNMNREVGDAGAPVIWLDPTISDGTVIADEALPGGQKQQASGAVGGTRTGLEWVTAPNTSYAVRLTNVAGAAKLAGIAINFYIESTGRSG